MRTSRLVLPLVLALAAPLAAQDSATTAAPFSGLRFRPLGPALTSGRIADFAVNPRNPAEYYVAVASGGVWKTENAGTTYEPVFDGEGAYSIGVVQLDPGNPSVVWVGSGENNAQRSVAYGDGVYKSVDGGRSWKRVGLENSEHIGRIAIDPRNSDVAYVAAQGPVWSAGGDRGLYKTTDGGKTWKRVLQVSEHTGVNDVVLDPRDPDVLYASAWQRRRHVWTFIGGGPESALYKSTDGGESWDKLGGGLPAGDVGRIGLCISPVDPDYLYAIIEAAADQGGFFRSTDRGGSWRKRSGYSTSGNYYSEIVCDPAARDRVYAMDVYAQVTDDGGATFRPLGERHKHVDNHALWVDPANPDHYLMGNDGGIYESWDRARTWQFKPNLPVTQFYKVALDNALPFYHVYGGTQDNFSLGGPSRTINAAGIVNSDWYVTNGGDGFESQADPTNPNIVYAQSQYGGLVRYDRQSGESFSIQPLPEPGEGALRWNWDSPLLISPHSPTRLYFAADRVYRSDDRGDSWRPISPDLARGLDRNQLPVMDRVWGVDAVAKNTSTSFYGNIVALDESRLAEGLLYAGTDDGLIHVTEDGGATWRKLERFPGVPDRTYVNMVLASRQQRGTVYAAFNNHKNGDFKPYLLRSTDGGHSWTSLSATLPARGSVYSIAEDHVDPQLLFVGTEFGLFCSRDGGAHWTQLKGGLPTIAVRDLAIQERENDLVLATFGRGFYVLDDYSPLRHASAEALASAATLFPVKDALLFLEARPLGLRGKAFQGESYYAAPNPPAGAVFTWYLKDALKTLKEQRADAEKKLVAEHQPVPYPGFDQLRAEDDEDAPYLLLTVTDAQGTVARRLRAAGTAGIQRLSWDLRSAPATPVSFATSSNPDDLFSEPPVGPLVTPGTYRVTLAKVSNGSVSPLAGPVEFQVKALNNATLAATDRAALLAFQRDAGELQRQLRTAGEQLGDAGNRLRYLREAVRLAPRATEAMLGEARVLETRLATLRRTFSGDASLARRQFETPPTMSDRLEGVIAASFNSTSAPGGAQRRQLEIAKTEFGGLRAELDRLLADLRGFEQRLEAAGAPYTPGRGR